MPQNSPKSSAQQNISIWFSDSEVSELFSFLLENLGYPAAVVSTSGATPQSERVITEPLFFPSLSEEQKRSCLLIGSPKSLEGLNALAIAQPLTEQKVSRALELFLRER